MSAESTPHKPRRWLSRLLAMGFGLLGLLLLGYLCSPWLISALVKRVAASQGITVSMLQAQRPGLNHWQIDTLSADNQGAHWLMRDVRLDYQWLGLQLPRLQQVAAAQLTVTLSPSDSSARDFSLDRSLLSALPEPLAPDYWLQRLPWQRLQVQRLLVAMPTQQLAAEGALSQQGTDVDVDVRIRRTSVAANSTTPAPDPLAYQALFTYGSAAGLHLQVVRESNRVVSSESQPEEHIEPLFQLRSRFGADFLDLNLRSALRGAEAQRLATMLGQPQAQLAGTLSAHTRLPWPLPAQYGLEELQLNGSFDINAALPNGIASASLQDLQLRKFAGTFGLQDAELSALLDSGTLAAVQQGTNSQALCDLTEPLVMRVSRTELELSDGLQCRLHGDRGELNVQLSELQYQAPISDDTGNTGTAVSEIAGALALRFGYQAAILQRQAQGDVHLRLQERGSEQLTGQADVRVRSPLFATPPNQESATTLPFTFDYWPQTARLELRMQHRYQLGERVLQELLGADPERYDLSNAQLDYQGVVQWQPDQWQASLNGAFSKAQWQNPQSAAASTLQLRPLSGEFDATLAASQLQLSGTLDLPDQDAGTVLKSVPYALDYDLERGTGRAKSTFAQTLADQPFTALFANWDQPFDLSAGQLQGQVQVRFANNQLSRLDAELQLAGGALRYEDFSASGLAADFNVQSDAQGLVVTSDALQIGEIDLGFPIQSVRAGFRYSALENAQITGAQPQELVQFEQVQAAVFGGQAAITRVQMDLATRESRFDLSLQQLSLAQLLALEGDDISGSGVLSGLLPVAITDGAQGLEVRVSDGKLVSEAPGGVIRLSEELANLTGQPGLDFAVQALRDFNYDRLTTTVSYAPNGDLDLGVALQGHNPEVERGRRIHYNINVSENLLSLLESLQADRLITEQVEQRVNQ